MLVEEYFESGDASEAVRCFEDLGAPHYGHQMIKTLIYRAVAAGEDHVRKSVLLVKALLDREVLDHHQVRAGSLLLI